MTAARVREALAGRDVAVIGNPDYAEGLSTSIRAGLATCRKDVDGAIFILGDMPRVTAAHIDRLIAAFNPVEGRASAFRPTAPSAATRCCGPRATSPRCRRSMATPARAA